jgi:hypothetical protein
VLLAEVAGTLDTFRIVAANAMSMPSAAAPGSTAPLPLENGGASLSFLVRGMAESRDGEPDGPGPVYYLICRITADVLTLRPSQAILSCESPQDWCG